MELCSITHLVNIFHCKVNQISVYKDFSSLPIYQECLKSRKGQWLAALIYTWQKHWKAQQFVRWLLFHVTKNINVKACNDILWINVTDNNVLYTTPKSLFLGAFAKLRIATISFDVSLHPHGTTRLPLDGFTWNLLLEYFSNICHENFKFH